MTPEVSWARPSAPGLLLLALLASCAVDVDVEIDDQAAKGGRSRGSLIAVERGSGRTAWRLRTGAVTEIEVAGSTVVALEGKGTDDIGRIRAVDLSSGRELWKRELGLHVDLRGPLLAHGRVFVVARDLAPGVVFDSTQPHMGLDFQHLRAFDLSTGEPLWTHRSRDGFSPPILAGGHIVIGELGEGRIRALDPASGEEVWSFRADRPPVSWPVAAGDLVIVGGTYGWLHAIDAASGREIWRSPFVGEPIERAYPLASRLVVVADSADVPLWASTAHVVALEDGRRLWDVEPRHLGGDVEAVGTEDLIAIAATTGVEEPSVLFGLDAAAGEEAWRFEAEGLGFPTLSGRAVYFEFSERVGESWGAGAVDTQTGELLFAVEGGDWSPFAPIADAAGATFPFGTEEGAGVLVRVDTERAEPDWRLPLPGRPNSELRSARGLILVGTSDAR